MSTRAVKTLWAFPLAFFVGGLVAVSGCTPLEVKTAEQHAAEGRWDEAVAAYREAARKDPYDESIKARLESAKARAAAQHFAEGRRLLKERRHQEAILELKLALTLDPSIKEHQAALADALRLKEAREQLEIAEKLRNMGHLDEAMEVYERAVKLDPALALALERITDLREAERADQPAPEFTQPITLRFQNTRLREVFEILARTSGVNIIVDRDVKDDPITIFLKDTPLDQALNMILSTNGLISRRLAPDTLVIMPNTKQKLEQYQDLIVRTFYLSTAKAKDLVNMLRSMLETKRIFVNEQLNAIVMRDRPEKIQLAERMILANDRREPEVLFDVEVLEVNRTKFLQYGLNFAKQATVTFAPPGGQPGRFTLDQLKAFGKDSYSFTLPSSVTLDFLKTESDARTLAAPKLRVLNNRQAKIVVGDKQPILLSTSNVLPGTSLTGAIPTTSTVTSIEFKDVGVKLTVEPTIHLTNEVTLKLQVEVTRVGEQVELQASPRIAQFKFGTRAAETILNLKEDETVVLGGLIQDEDRKQRSTIPLLGDIPILGRLFSSDQINTVTTEVVLTITPHIVKEPSLPSIETQEMWSGTETNYATKPLYPISVRKRNGGRGPVEPNLSSPRTSPDAPGLAAPGSNRPSAPAQQPSSAPEPRVEPSGGARGSARVALKPVEFQAQTGQEFHLDVTVDHLESLTESVVTLSFNPTLIVFQGASEGELLTRDGVRAAVMVKPGAVPGQLELHLKRHGPPASGEGTLVSVRFQAKGRGVAPVEIQEVRIGGDKAEATSAIMARSVVLVR